MNEAGYVLGVPLDLLFNGLIVIFTGVLAASTVLLFHVTKKAANAAEHSAQAALKSAVIQNRPRLIVRWIYLTEDDRTVQYEIANVGGDAAHIVALHASCVIGDLPQRAPFSDAPNVSPPLQIDAGQYLKQSKAVLSDDDMGELRFQIGFAKGSERDFSGEVYFIGYIIYKDPHIGIAHRTAFCRQYDPNMRRFMWIDKPDPDYEHAD